MLYYSLIYPYLIYCVIVWGCAAKTNMLKLTSLQKRAIRIIAKANYLDHTSAIYKKYQILKLNDLHLFYCCAFLYKLKHNSLPSTCHDFMTWQMILTLVIITSVFIMNLQLLYIVLLFVLNLCVQLVLITGIRCHLTSRTLLQQIALNTRYGPTL